MTIRTTRSAHGGMSATARREQIAFASATADAMRRLGARQTRAASENGPDAGDLLGGLHP